MKKGILYLAGLLLMLISSDTFAQSDEELFKNWMVTLGSDEFGGRKPMTEYETKTINYIADQMKAIGLEPAFDGSYFQKVRLINSSLSFADNAIKVKGSKKKISLKSEEDFMVWSFRTEEKINLSKVEFMFCGFGIDAPEYNWNDFEGIDVRGKIVIAMVNDPGYYDGSLFRGKNMTYYGRWCYKFEQAMRLGAVGCLVLHNTEAASYGWHVCVNGHNQNNLGLYDAATDNSDELTFKGWLSEAGCRKLFEAAGADFESALAAAKKPGFKAFSLKAKADAAITIKYEIAETCNVGGILPGTDLKDEAVVFGGHWDHFGFGKPDETGDCIYNGTADNASGVAAVLILAKKYKSMPVSPRRSMLFMCMTSEESGLYGSQHYCDNPVFPMEKTVGCINFDCIAPEPRTHDVRILREKPSVMDTLINIAASAQGRYVVYETDNSDGWFYRSDHFNFFKKGVPAVVVGYGYDLVDPSHPNKYPKPSWYHKPNDEYREDWNLEGTMEHINMMFAVGEMLGVR